MPFRGVTFSGQNVTPKNDGGLYNAHYGDGILWGCSMAISGDDLVIQSGEFIMGGRVVQVDGATNVDLSGRTLQTGYIQVIMNADLTQGEGSQWYTTFVESATTTFPALTQDDINDTGTLYQVALAIVQVSGGNLVSIYSSMYNSILISSGGADIDEIASVKDARIRILQNGTEAGRLWHSVTNNYFQLNNALSESGVRMFDAGSVILYGDGGVTLRPNGANTTSGQVRINTDGEIDGGWKVYPATGSTSSVPASTKTTLRTVTGLSSSALYSCNLYASFTPASGTTCVPSLYLDRNDTGYRVASLQSSNTTQKFLSFSYAVTGATKVGLAMYSTVALTIGSASLDVYRIG